MAFRSAVPLGRGTDLRRPQQREEAPSLSPRCLLLQLSRSLPERTQTFPVPPMHGETGNTCKKSEYPLKPRNLRAACPPATELSGPYSLNAHFVPLSTGLIDINSCAQSAHSVFSWPDAVGMCVIILNGSLFQVGMKYEQFGHQVNDNLCLIH